MRQQVLWTAKSPVVVAVAVRATKRVREAARSSMIVTMITVLTVIGRVAAEMKSSGEKIAVVFPVDREVIVVMVTVMLIDREVIAETDEKRTMIEILTNVVMLADDEAVVAKSIDAALMIETPPTPDAEMTTVIVIVIEAETGVEMTTTEILDGAEVTVEI